MNLIKTFIFEICDTNILKTCFEIFLVLVLDVYKFSISNIYNISTVPYLEEKYIRKSSTMWPPQKLLHWYKMCSHTDYIYIYIYIYIYKFTLYALICKYQIRIYSKSLFFKKSQLYFGLFKNLKTVHQTKGVKPIST